MKVEKYRNISAALVVSLRPRKVTDLKDCWEKQAVKYRNTEGDWMENQALNKVANAKDFQAKLVLLNRNNSAEVVAAVVN